MSEAQASESKGLKGSRGLLQIEKTMGNQKETTTSTTWASPYYMMTCPGTQAMTTQSMTEADYDNITAEIQALYNSLPSTCTPTECPQADWAGCVLRMAGHDFMDYKDGQGGADGCVDLTDADNLGLAECLFTGEFGISIADAYQHFCQSVSLADFLVIAAEAVMSASRQHVTLEDSSRSTIDFKSSFKFGRTTAKTCEWAHGRLPNPENSCSAVQETFVESMGLTWGQAAALMGVHTLGRAQIANSGYNGWWSSALMSRKFNNDYYVSILAKGWGPEVAVAGNAQKNQWKRVDAGANETGLGKEMMLNTDLCLAFTMDDAGTVELDAATAASAECKCTWGVPVAVSTATTKYEEGRFCGSTNIPGSSNFRQQRAICCGEEFDGRSDAAIDCGLPIDPKGPAYESIKKFANNEDAWLRVFKAAWRTATGNGFSLRRLRS
ncbi:Putative ascorbate peroxidase (HvAPX1) [Durusdinium trenchii]|uniref:Ascorbate peroxidase (HvAPX1) n=1 Tax=Durusdinium trenchii TaxID=1381693 RepID=A0ABP0S7T9_9DINO